MSQKNNLNFLCLSTLSFALPAMSGNLSAGNVVLKNRDSVHKIEITQHVKRPNILFILVDDLGWNDVGFMGSKYYETPNIDQLAQSEWFRY